MLKRHYVFAALCFGSGLNDAYALSIPSMSHSQSYDEVRTSDGTTCHSSTYGPQLQIGVAGGVGDDDQDHNYYGKSRTKQDEKAVYAQISIPIGGPARIDCTALYNLEVKRKQLELKQLEAQIKELEARAKLAGLKLPELK